MATNNKKLTIYLLKQNLNFEQYLKKDKDITTYKVEKFFIDKTNMGNSIVSGRIYLFTRPATATPWIGYINAIAKKKKEIKLKPNSDQKALIFLKIYCTTLGQHHTYALTFSGAHQLLNPTLIVPDFAFKVSKSLVAPDKVASLDSIAIDRKIYNTRKQSSSYLLPDKMTSGEYNIVKKFHGRGESRKLVLSAAATDRLLVGGESGLSISGKFNLNKDLTEMLVRLSKIYEVDTEHDQLFKVPENLKTIDGGMKSKLNEVLGKKFKSILTSKTIDKRNLKGISIQPQKIFDLENFNGFFITGIGYRDTRQTGDFEIDEVNYFERLKKVLKIDSQGNLLTDGDDIIRKMEHDVIKRKFTDGTPSEKVCSLYQALSVELTYKKDKYILVAGEWYRIDRNFYAHLKQEIDNIPSDPTHQKLIYIPFDVTNHSDSSGKKKEGLYNEDLAKTNKVLMLDRTKYSPGAAILRKLQIKTSSNIELSDIFLYNNVCIEFIHIKRHSGGAAGTSHLLAQAIASAKTFNEDTENVVTFINNKIIEHNNDSTKTYQLPIYKNKKQKKQITLAIIDKNAFTANKQVKKNSIIFSVLEMISIIENIRNLENLGYECYLKFINSNET